MSELWGGGGAKYGTDIVNFLSTESNGCVSETAQKWEIE